MCIRDRLSEMIIGLEWLERQKAVWNFSERWIRLQDRELSLYSLPRGNKCRKVAVARDVNVPAMCELDIEVYAILPDLSNEDKKWATRPQLLESGLVVAGTLLPDRTDDLIMRVLNPTVHALSLKRGNEAEETLPTAQRCQSQSKMHKMHQVQCKSSTAERTPVAHRGDDDSKTTSPRTELEENGHWWKKQNMIWDSGGQCLSL